MPHCRNALLQKVQCIMVQDGLRAEEGILYAVKTWPELQDQQDSMQFLGFYRKFVSNFSDMIDPKTNLLKKEEEEEPYDWTTEETTEWTAGKLIVLCFDKCTCLVYS